MLPASTMKLVTTFSGLSILGPDFRWRTTAYSDGSIDPDGTLQGTVQQVLFSDQGTHPICDKCEGERHGKPVEGMVIMWGVKQDGDVWDGGQILDPHNGKTYKVKLSLKDDGRKLDVRGYIGMPMLGRTQTWLRKSD